MPSNLAGLTRGRELGVQGGQDRLRPTGEFVGRRDVLNGAVQTERVAMRYAVGHDPPGIVYANRY